MVREREEQKEEGMTRQQTYQKSIISGKLLSLLRDEKWATTP